MGGEGVKLHLFVSTLQRGLPFGSPAALIRSLAGLNLTRGVNYQSFREKAGALAGIFKRWVHSQAP